MHYKLDIDPIPEEVLYVNDLSLTGKVPYETKDDMEKAVTGKKKSEGGILPDDNVRIYVPMDLNAEGIMWWLYALYGSLGYPTESNESAYYSGVRKIITQLEIYDQVCVARKEESVQKANGGESTGCQTPGTNSSIGYSGNYNDRFDRDSDSFSKYCSGYIGVLDRGFFSKIY